MMFVSIKVKGTEYPLKYDLSSVSLIQVISWDVLESVHVYSIIFISLYPKMTFLTHPNFWLQ